MSQFRARRRIKSDDGSPVRNGRIKIALAFSALSKRQTRQIRFSVQIIAMAVRTHTHESLHYVTRVLAGVRSQRRASEGSLPHSHGPSWCHSCIADDRRGDMVTAVRAIRSSCTHGGAAGLPGLTQAEHRPLASPDCKRPETSRGVGCPAGLDGSEALAHQAFGDRLHLPVEAAHTHDGRANARALAALADHSEAVTLIEGALRAAGQ